MPIAFSGLSVQQSLFFVLGPIFGSHCVRVAASPELEGGEGGQLTGYRYAAP